MTGHTIVCGYGLPGRAIVDILHTHGIPHCVIELNPDTVSRCSKIGTHIIAGSCSDPDVLQRAGIAGATTFVLAIPDDHAALEATQHARRMNPSIHIIARCHFTSAGIEAKARGANEVIVAEQLVATEMSRRMEQFLSTPVQE